MRPVPFAALFSFVLVGGCTPGIGTRIDEPVRPATTVQLETLVVLPITADLGSGNAGPAVEEAVLGELATRWPDVAVVEPGEARRRLGSAGAAAALAQMIRDYEMAGVADLTRVDSVGAALEASHFLQLRVGLSEREVLREEVFTEFVTDEDRREVVLVARLWSRAEPGPVWEGAVRAWSETHEFSGGLPEQSEMVRKVTARLLTRLPLARRPLAQGGATQ